MASGLFGIEHTNRPDYQHWTKNCFNSSFPTSLACYMMSNNMPVIYARLAHINGQLKVVCETIEIKELFRCGDLQPHDLQFDFESKFEPYQSFSFDSIDGIDLVIRNTSGEYLAPIEIKLTVLPTSATAEKPESDWGSEIVVRSATTSYCALSMWSEVKDHNKRIREIFEDACSNIGSWTNDYEMAHKTANLREAIDLFQQEYIDYQRPLVLQAIWKTDGQSPVLRESAFDIVVWSNLAFTRLFRETENEKTMSRPMRASARMARCLWELSKSGKIRVEEIYRQMAYGLQTDKEVAVSGDRWRKYIATDRIMNPAVHRDALNEIISPGFIEYLRPERRLDQALYFAVRK